MLRRLWPASLTAILLSACGDSPTETTGVDDSTGGADSSDTGAGSTPSGTTGDEPTTGGPGTQSGTDDDTSGGPPGDTSTTTAPVDPTTTTEPGDTTTTSDDTTSDPTADPTADPTGDLPGVDCLAMQFLNDDAPVIDYEQYEPVIGSHCKGTNHQDITDIERVVFLGDSVTVGTPPTGTNDYYRVQLAELLVDKFGLTPPNLLWQTVNPLDGVTLAKESGDFASCSKWGARTDDFKPDMDGQLSDCFPPDMFDKRTLVIYTMGGNDLAAIAKDGIAGKTLPELQAMAQSAVDYQREAVHWLVDDPDKFPNGVFVVYANVYEFSDGTADLMSCPQAALAGFDKPYPNPDELKDLVIWVNEQFMSVAVETATDMVFLLETFCGHGFRADDPTAPCYRGPNQETWFDLTCIHPTPAGHTAITDLFSAVLDE